jgi:predicted lactoylglutathione lyase
MAPARRNAHVIHSGSIWSGPGVRKFVAAFLPDHPHSVKQHTAFAAKTRAEVDAFHAAALKAGGAENGAPGLRRPNYYAAFVLDPDGNNIEAVFRGT